jgi:titin
LWSVSATAGTASIDTSGNVTVTGIPQGTSATVTVATSRDDYTSRSATVSSNIYPVVPKAGLTPTFSTPISTASGFTTNFTNYDSLYDLVIKTNIGQVVSGSPVGSSLPLTVTGLTTGQSATITISTARSGFLSGSGTVTGSSIAGTGLTPIFSSTVPTSNGFTLNVINYDSAYTYNVTTSAGTITKGGVSGSNLPLTVSGLVAGQSATITVSTLRNGYATINATTTGSAISGGALNPSFGIPVSNVSGFSVNMSNYDSKFTYSVSSTLGTATINSVGTVSVSGLTPGTSATVRVSTARTGYASGSGSVTGSSLIGAALLPMIGVQTSIANGLTFQVTNYDSKFAWGVTTTLGTSTISPTGLITLNGLTPGNNFSFTVTTTRVGYNTGTVTKSANTPVGVALNPQFGAVSQTVDGIKVSVINYDPSYQWFLTSTNGTGTIDQTGLITVVNMKPGSTTSISIKTTRNGYNSGMGNISGSAKAYVATNPTATKKPQVTPQKPTITPKPTTRVTPKVTAKPTAPVKKPAIKQKSGKPTAKIITCSNGSTTKRIVGYNPRCPTGFVRKG